MRGWRDRRRVCPPAGKEPAIVVDLHPLSWPASLRNGLFFLVPCVAVGLLTRVELPFGTLGVGLGLFVTLMSRDFGVVVGRTWVRSTALGGSWWVDLDEITHLAFVRNVLGAGRIEMRDAHGRRFRVVKTVLDLAPEARAALAGTLAHYRGRPGISAKALKVLGLDGAPGAFPTRRPAGR